MMMKKKMRRQGGGVCSKRWRKKMKRQGITRSMLPNKSPSFLPEEIISNDILPKLPVKSITRFKSVSNTWSSLLSDPYFIKLHYNHGVQQNKFSLILNDPQSKRIYSIDFDSLASEKPLHITDYPFVSLQSDTRLRFVGSCNGLVCFTYHRHVSIHMIYLWNPSTDECTLVPPPPPPRAPVLDALESFKIRSVGLGFGYDFKLDTYKIFMVTSVSDHPDSLFTFVRSYTLGSDPWKVNNDKIPYKILGDLAGKFFNGALHWMGTGLTEGLNKTEYHLLLSCNVGDERFKELSIPKSLNDKDTAKFSTFGVLRENLCIFDNSWQTYSDVWVMKEYGVSESWTKLLAIPKYNPEPNSVCYLKLINSFEKGDILLRKDDNSIFLYDKQKRTTIPKLGEAKYSLVSCVSSLVSLNSKIYFKQELGDISIQIPTPV